MINKTYIAIDLKSFFASVECVERGLDPLKARLVVADEERTDKTICLAVSPALKAYGIPGRVRLYEAKAIAKKFNIDFIIARPRMSTYMEVSSFIMNIYRKYISDDDMHIYSVDEVFIDATQYLTLYKLTASEFAIKLVKDVLYSTGITATVGIGTNMYLAKVAMDIVAKHCKADENGVRIAELDEEIYRRTMWEHKPITDFWRIGKGIAKILESHGMYTQKDIAEKSLTCEDELYSYFGKNAELIIDHAWGYEPCTINEIKRYRPESRSVSLGQVLKEPYCFNKALIVIKEMAENLAIDLAFKKLYTNQIVLTVCYDISNTPLYDGQIKKDYYGRFVPKDAHGSINLDEFTNNIEKIIECSENLFREIVNQNLTIRRIYIVANNVDNLVRGEYFEQISLFNTKHINKQEEDMQNAIINLKEKFGMNSILHASSLEKGATAIERNNMVGGHRK